MRKALFSTVAFAFAVVATVATASAAMAPKMSKMGCMVGKQKWDAAAGKCVDAPKMMVKKTSKAKAAKAMKAAKVMKPA